MLPKYAQTVEFTNEKCEIRVMVLTHIKLTTIFYCIFSSWITHSFQSSCIFLHSWLSLLRHPLVHPHDIISEHAFGISGRESDCGNNCPSVCVQPMSVTNGRTGIGELSWI